MVEYADIILFLSSDNVEFTYFFIFCLTLENINSIGLYSGQYETLKIYLTRCSFK